MPGAPEQRGEVEVRQLAREGEKDGDAEVATGFNMNQVTDADAGELREPLLGQVGRVPCGAVSGPQRAGLKPTVEDVTRPRLSNTRGGDVSARVLFAGDVAVVVVWPTHKSCGLRSS